MGFRLAVRNFSICMSEIERSSSLIPAMIGRSKDLSCPSGLRKPKSRKIGQLKFQKKIKKCIKVETRKFGERSKINRRRRQSASTEESEIR